MGVRAANPFVPIVAIAEGAEVSKGLWAERGSQGRELNSRLDPSPASAQARPALGRETRPSFLALYKPRPVEGTVEPFRGSDRF